MYSYVQSRPTEAKESKQEIIYDVGVPEYTINGYAHKKWREKKYRKQYDF